MVTFLNWPLPFELDHCAITTEIEKSQAISLIAVCGFA